MDTNCHSGKHFRGVRNAHFFYSRKLPEHYEHSLVAVKLNSERQVRYTQAIDAVKCMQPNTPVQTKLK